MRAGAIAEQAGVNRQTLRFYERESLLPNRPDELNRTAMKFLNLMQSDLGAA